MRKYLLFMLMLLIVFLTSYDLYCQPFSLDTTFQSSYSFRDPYFNYRAGAINKIFEMPDGSLRLSGGFYDPYTPNPSMGILKLHQNGEYDPAFHFPGGPSGATVFRYMDYLYFIGLMGDVGRVDIQTGEVDSIFRANKDSSDWGGD